MSPERITEVLNSLGGIAKQGEAWHDAATGARSARSQSLASINMIGRRDEHAEAVAEAHARHASALYELQRDELLRLLDVARDLVDDRPKLAKPEAA